MKNEKGIRFIQLIIIFLLLALIVIILHDMRIDLEKRIQWEKQYVIRPAIK